MESNDTKEEKRHRDILQALGKITAAISALTNEVVTLRHAINEAAKRK